MWDIFICHAWEDNETIARPLAQALSRMGLTVWYDEFTLKLGDSLRRSIDYGISQSRYGVVVLSPDFFAKEWPQRELDGLVAREISSGKIVLPIWHNVTRKDIERFSPVLADRLGVLSARGLDIVIQEIMRVVSPQPSRDVESRSEVSIFVEKHAFQEELKRPTTLITVTDSDFEETLKKHDAVVVYFWAVWCMPCKMIAPHVEALAKKMAGNVVFGKLNVDENPRTATRFQIMNIPTLMVFKNGQPVKRIVGAVPQQHIERQIMEVL